MVSIADHLSRRLGDSFRMPAEWELHQATYLTWPHNLDTWPGKFDPIPPAFAKIVAELSHSEEVRLLVQPNQEVDEVRTILERANAAMDRVKILPIATNDSWIRDYGPIFVNRVANSPSQVALDFRFNSWGQKYGAFDLDDAVPRRLGESFGFEVIDADFVLEGGSIDSNGAGSLLVTESCLLNPNRNPKFERDEIEAVLRAALGATNVLWLGEGIAGDDTDGHIDDLARFVNPATIATVVEQDPADENYRPLRDNLERLRSMRDERGRPFRIEKLPMPRALYHDNTRLPASYANFYIANGCVLVPTFDCPSDSVALSKLQRLFPGRRVVGIHCTDLVWGLGAIHCLTQQHPVAA